MAVKKSKTSSKTKEEKSFPSSKPSLAPKPSKKALPRKDSGQALRASGQAQTMEELLASTGYQLKGVKKGDLVEGTISRVSPKEITVDTGGKTEAVVIDRELENYRDTLLSLKPGDRVVAQVIVAENDRGQSVLSLRRSIFEKRWADLSALQKSGTPVDVIIKDPVRGGVLVDYGGLRGYIPQSQLDSTLAKQLDRAIGRRIQAKIIEVDKESNRLVFSQRAMSEEAALIKQKEFLDIIKVGENVEATVTGVVPFGAFAKFTINKNGEKHEVEGLIHISEIAWEKVDNPSEYMKIGDSMKLKVIGIDEATGKLTLSLKQLLPDPWEHVLDMFEKDSQVKGTVSRVSPYGIFVTLSHGIEGLIHISKVAPGEEPKVGQEINCIVEDIKPDQRKISLSMALKEKPIGYR